MDQKTETKQSKIKSINIVLICLVLFLSVVIIRNGLTDIIVNREWEKVKINCSECNIKIVINTILKASWMTLECGIRTLISEPLFILSNYFDDQGNAVKAHNLCKVGRDILDRYEPKIELRFKCYFATEINHRLTYPLDYPSPIEFQNCDMHKEEECNQDFKIEIEIKNQN